MHRITNRIGFCLDSCASAISPVNALLEALVVAFEAHKGSSGAVPKAVVSLYSSSLEKMVALLNIAHQAVSSVVNDDALDVDAIKASKKAFDHLQFERQRSAAILGRYQRLVGQPSAGVTATTDVRSASSTLAGSTSDRLVVCLEVLASTFGPINTLFENVATAFEAHNSKMAGGIDTGIVGVYAVHLEETGTRISYLLHAINTTIQDFRSDEAAEHLQSVAYNLLDEHLRAQATLVRLRTLIGVQPLSMSEAMRLVTPKR